MDIANNIKALAKSIPEQVKLIAVSKTQPASAILKAYDSGHKIFGENRVQELCLKQSQLPQDIEWHMIGHLQSNKVKTIAGFVDYIHSIDSIKLINTINSCAQKYDRTINCMLQVHIAQEKTKYGFDFEEITQLFSLRKLDEFKYINIVGLMGMATFTKDLELIKSEFKSLNQFFLNLSAKYGQTYTNFKDLSMGMSGDYAIAIEEGSTMVRIGSKIFGQRKS